MISNLWQNARFFCINNHPEPIPMAVMEGSSKFYACPHYMKLDAQHPDGWDPEKGEGPCANRISFTMAANIMGKFMKTIEKDDREGVTCDYTGYRFRYQGFDVQILKYSPKGIDIGVKNLRI